MQADCSVKMICRNLDDTEAEILYQKRVLKPNEAERSAIQFKGTWKRFAGSSTSRVGTQNRPQVDGILQAVVNESQFR